MTSRSKRGHGQEEGILQYKVHDRESKNYDRQPKINDRLLDNELSINVDHTVYDPEVNESYDR